MYSSTPSLYFYSFAVCTQIHTNTTSIKKPLLLSCFCWAVCRPRAARTESVLWCGAHVPGMAHFLLCGKDVFPLDDCGILQAITFKGKFTNLNNWDASENIKVAKFRVRYKIAHYVIHYRVDIVSIKAVSLSLDIFNAPVSCVTLDFLHFPRE